MKHTILILLVATLSCTGTWTRAQKGWCGAFVAAEVYDVVTTIKTLDAGAVEMSPFLGSHPGTAEVIAYKVIGTGLLGLFLDTAMMDDSRGYACAGLTGAQLYVDFNNYNTMIKMKVRH